MTAAAEPESAVEGEVQYVQPGPDGRLEVELAVETNRFFLDIENSDGKSPALSSRIRVPGRPVVDQAGVARLAVARLNDLQWLSGSEILLARNAAELRRLGSWGQHVRCVAHLEGLVLVTGAGGDMLALQDDTGVVLLETDQPGQFPVPGQQIILEGNCEVEGDHVFLRNPPLVDNDDIHAMAEKSGAIFLTAGKHPFQLDWFNQVYPYGLEVYYQGPGLPRQKIPDAALFRQVAGPKDEVRWVSGLDYRCYQGNWLRVPDFGLLAPVKQGVTANFDPGLITRVNDVGLQFAGYVEVPRAGIYTFTTISDDGSLMFMNETPPVIKLTGKKTPPDPVSIAVRQSLGADQEGRWSQIEGTVTFVSKQAGMLELEVGSETGRMRVEVVDSSGGSPLLLLNSRIRAAGICLATRLVDGQSVAGTLIVPGMGQIEIREIPSEFWSDHPLIPIGNLAGLEAATDAETIVHVRGKIESPTNGTWFVRDETGSVQLETPPPQVQSRGTMVEVLGCFGRKKTNAVLRCVFFKDTAGKPGEALPVLASVEQIKRLARAEWEDGYPVQIRGVITTVLDSGFFIQDSTGSIYARWRAPTDFDVPRVGEYFEIKGRTFAEFAPNIQVSSATRLGRGTMPEPLHPTWDKLINGSLDTEYVEVQGIVTAIKSEEITLLTRAGEVQLLLPDVQSQTLRRCENALVRVRGCVIPVRDLQTQQVVPGRMQLSNVSIAVDEPALADPFSLLLKRVSDLLLFDLRAGALQRVKIAGQIVHESNGQLFLMDGSAGLRAIPKSMDGWQVGDLVEVVGFPDLGGPSPILREAVARRTGSAKLPAPVLLPPNLPLNRRYDATLIRVQARLTALNRDQSEQVLKLQSGTCAFVARLKTSDGLLPVILPGSLLELTGVYAGLGSDLASGQEINSFELLLNSSSDVGVLARPSWWTIRHTLTVLGGMTFFILAALVWIVLLRRQVEERSKQLATEIRRHEHTERQRELEEERTRIARDLHDDLGATLTQIRFLSALESRDSQLPEATRHRIRQVSEKSHEMVASLDEIVWAVNPANDSLPSLANYLCHFAEEFFRSTPIRCRLDIDDSLPAAPLTSEVRHNLYLTVREALNNIAKHSQATEVWLRIHSRPAEGFCLIIEDNGRGFTPGTAAGNGLANMRQRLEKIGGRFEFETRPGAGVVCRLHVPVEIQPPAK